jgi:transposase
MDTKTQPTIWEVPAEVWVILEPGLNDLSPSQPKEPRRVELRRVLHGLSLRVRTGGPWHRLPACLGDDRPGPRHVQPWCHRGLFPRLWAVLVDACGELGGVAWPWPAAATMRGQAQRGGDLVGRNPTDRGQKGGNGAASWKRQAVPWAPYSLRPTSTIPSCWRPPWRPSGWTVRRQPHRCRRPSAWTRATTLPLGMKPWPPLRTPRISAASVKKSSLPTASRPLRRAGGGRPDARMALKVPWPPGPGREKSGQCRGPAATGLGLDVEPTQGPTPR